MIVPRGATTKPQVVLPLIAEGSAAAAATIRRGGSEISSHHGRKTAAAAGATILLRGARPGTIRPGPYQTCFSVIPAMFLSVIPVILVMFLSVILAIFFVHSAVSGDTSPRSARSCGDYLVFGCIVILCTGLSSPHALLPSSPLLACLRALLALLARLLGGWEGTVRIDLSDFKNPHQPGAVRAAPGGAGCSPTVPP